MTKRLSHVRRVFAIAGILCGSLQGGDAGTERCQSALDQGDFAAALREANALVSKNPKSAEARVFLAQAEMGANHPQAALRHLEEALELEPSNLDALYYLSKLTAVLSQQEMGAALRLDPDGLRAHQITAEILAAQGKTDEAEQEYLKALAKHPGLVTILNALGDLKRTEAKYDLALGWYEKAVEKDPRNYDAVYGAGASLWFLKRVPQAEKQFRRCLEIDPGSLAAKLALGESLMAQGKAQEALRHLEPAAAADPNFRRLQFLLARAYKALGREEDANRAFARYRQLTREQGEEERYEFTLEAKP